MPAKLALARPCRPNLMSTPTLPLVAMALRLTARHPAMAPKTPRGGGASKEEVADPAVDAADSADSADAPAVAAPAADDGIATAADGGEPAPQADGDGFTDYGGLSIQGGTPGTDYDLETVTYTHYCRSSTRPAGSNSGRDITVYPQYKAENTISSLVIKKDGTYRLKNTQGVDTAVATSIRVEPRAVGGRSP